jgi:hypothetical protein
MDTNYIFVVAVIVNNKFLLLFRHIVNNKKTRHIDFILGILFICTVMQYDALKKKEKKRKRKEKKN